LHLTVCACAHDFVVVEVSLKVLFADHDPAPDVNGAELACLDQPADRKMGHASETLGGFRDGDKGGLC